MARVLGLLIGVLFINNSQAISQTLAPGYSEQFWGIEEGLPVNEVSDIEQTQNGYIWLSTYDGLVRFDGNRFVLFNKGNTDGIISNRLQGFRKSASDDLFILTDAINGSEHLILFRDNQFQSFELGINDLRLIISISFYEDNELRIVNNFRILAFDGNNFVPAFREIIDRKVYAIAPSNDQGMWVSTDQGILKVKDQVLERYTENEGLISDDGNRIFQDSEGRLWVNNESGIQFIKDKIVHRIEIPDNNLGLEYIITNGFEDKSRPGRVLFLLSKDYFLVYYNGDTQLISTDNLLETGVQFKLIGGDSLDHDKSWQNIGNKLYHNGVVVYENPSKINQILEDKNGGVWVATDFGLHHFREKLFSSFSKEKGNIFNTYPLLEDRLGGMWTGNLAGDILNLQNDSWEIIDDVGADRVFSLYADKNNNIWAGKRPGIEILNRQISSGFEEISTPFDGRITQVRSIFEDLNGNVWIGSRHGLFGLTNQNEWIEVKSETPGKEVRSVRVMFESKDGTLWIGTNGSGLFYKNSSGLFSFEANERLSDTIIRSIYEDDDGILWIGLEGGGLDRIEFLDDQIEITNYGLDDGLFDTVIHVILEDDHGRFWMSSNKGIFWVEKSELNAFAKQEIERIHSTFYNEQDGLPGREANGGMQHTGIKTSDGTFWFSMVGGVATINPSNVIQNTAENRTIVESIITGDSTYSNLSGNISLSKGERDLQFVYTAFNYQVKPENILFRYRLKGYIDEWINAGPRREGFFTNVSAGTYTFEVQASIDGDTWSAIPSSQTIEIEPYFRETAFFWILMILSGVSILFVSYRLRTSRLLKKQQELEQVVEERTEDLIFEKKQVEKQKEVIEALVEAKNDFFTNISHELRTPLTLVLGPLQQLSKTNGELKEEFRHQVKLANRNGLRLKELVEQVLDLARLDSSKLQLRLSKVDVSQLVKSQCESFENIARKKGINFISKIPKDSIFIAADVDKLQKIVTNLISNAVKFTSYGNKVEVELISWEHEILIHVTDSGKGIDHRNIPHIFDRFHSNNERISGGGHGLGVGLHLTKEFIDLHEGSITVESELGKGSTFAVLLPKRAHDLVGLKESILIDDEFHEKDELSLGTKRQTSINGEAGLILLVEDNIDMRTYLSELLTNEGMRVIEAENGVEGKKQLSLHTPDLIISDVMMPDMDGFEFADLVRSKPEHKLTPIVMLTALTGYEDRIQAFEIGVSDYLTKPFHETELITRVQNLLRLKEERTEIVSEKEELSVDSEFVQSLKNYVIKNISNHEITAESLGAFSNMSRRALYYKIKSSTGFTPAEFVREIRLTQARYILEGKRRQTIAEVAYDVGFSTPSYFSKVYKQRFGTHPKDLIR